jgi:hypothetical protein
MNSFSLGQTIAILANVGVIAGIVFLAIEVRQNQATLEEANAMNQIAVENTAQEHFSYFRALILENDELFDIWQNGMTGAELTDSEETKFRELCTEHLFRMLQSHRMRFRLDPDSQYRSAARVVAGLIAQSTRYETCWNELRPAFQVSESFGFVGFVEEAIE